jgi:hypothetical protein
LRGSRRSEIVGGLDSAAGWDGLTYSMA